MCAARSNSFTASPITVATGVPRSGTSLLMQMLEAAGVPILADTVRAPDVFNPRGYYELEAVKSTARDPAWTGKAAGHAVKVIHALLRHLPAESSYRVILIERDLAEVVASQTRMLGETDARISQTRLAQIFAAQLEEVRVLLDERDCFEWIEVNHRDLLERPLSVAKEIADFLGIAQFAPAMAAVVDPELHREHTDELDRAGSGA
ncbi:MAG: sulfotransferase [bacterium]|nr:sulfotransferase [bacterium]